MVTVSPAATYTLALRAFAQAVHSGRIYAWDGSEIAP